MQAEDQAQLVRQLLRAGGADVEGAHDIIVVLRPRGRIVRRDDDRVRANPAIEGGVGFQKQRKGLLKADVFGKKRDIKVFDAFIEDHVDAVSPAKRQRGLFE